MKYYILAHDTRDNTDFYLYSVKNWLDKSKRRSWRECWSHTKPPEQLSLKDIRLLFKIKKYYLHKDIILYSFII